MNTEPRAFSVRNLGFVLVAAALLAACAKQEQAAAPPPAAAPPSFASQITPDVEKAAGAITADAAREQIRVLASDEFEGRFPATEGDRKTQAYLIEQLKGMGYEPGGPEGSWQQPFDVVGVNAKMPAQWSFTKDGKRVAVKWSEQYIAASGVQESRGAVRDAELVFVGYGIQAPEFQWDDFKGQDMKGKVLVMLNSDPDWDPALFAGKTRLYYGRWTYKYEMAARVGAAGAIIVHTTPSAGYPWQVVQSSWGGEQFELPAEGEPRITVRGWATEEASKQIAALGGQDLAKLMEQAKSRDFQPVPLGVKTSISFTTKVVKKTTANVAGLLRGSDATLASEVVVYSAHHDHLGVGEPDAAGDRIYNGAKDNASGVAAVLGIARAFKALPAPPKRSVLMLFVAAEEQGTLGSEYYATHPTFPAGRIAANINYDDLNMLGRTRDLTFVGLGKSSLDQIVKDLAARQKREVKPDQEPDKGYFYRSDQFSFAKVGVPAFYPDKPLDFVDRPAGWGKQQADDYTEHRYHQPSDELDPGWDYSGFIEDAQVGFYTGYVVANATQMPQWNAGDEFEAARKAALAAAR